MRVVLGHARPWHVPVALLHVVGIGHGLGLRVDADTRHVSAGRKVGWGNSALYWWKVCTCGLFWRLNRVGIINAIFVTARRLGRIQTSLYAGSVSTPREQEGVGQGQGKGKHDWW